MSRQEPQGRPGNHSDPGDRDAENRVTADRDDRRAGSSESTDQRNTAGDSDAAGRKSTDQPTPHVGDTRAERRFQGGLITLSRWTLRLLIIAAGAWGLGWLLGRFWSILLPILLGLFLSTVLWPPVRWLRRHMPNALAALIAVVALLGSVAGLIALLAPGVSAEVDGLIEQASAGLGSLQQWLTGPPFNLEGNSLGDLIDQGVQQLQNNSEAVLGVVLNSLGAIGSAVITFVLALVLAFFFLKDGPMFVPWLHRWTSEATARHVEAVSGRVWTALGQFIWSQAAVALADAIFIGLGVWILGVPFALPIAVLTFFGGFVPIVGAFVAGGVAVLVGLVSGGIWIALGVLGIVVAVQQIEGNVLQPILVGRTLAIHPALVIVAVSLGGTLFGVIGAFLAVPVFAVLQVIARYVREQIGAAPAAIPGSR